jgi:very-short-patch-repair endonuclease
LKQPCGDCWAIDGLRSSNFAGRSHFKTLFAISFVLKSGSKRIVIEIDGSQHASSERDTAREAVLMAEGFRITRYWNNDVLQRPSAVLEDILAKLAEP